jgi:predicted Zn-dependent peptidase
MTINLFKLRRCGLIICLLSTTQICTTLFAQTPDRSAPPKLGPPPSLTLPAIQRFQLSNGLPVVLMEKSQVPLVQINLLIRAGSAMEPTERAGLASLTADLLDKGAGNRNALQLADAIDFLGANFSAGAGHHTTVVSINTPLAQLDSALALFANVVLRPTFPDEELSRLRKEKLTTLLQWHDQPRSIASVMFNRTLYGEQHPYGRPSLGDEPSLRALATGDLRNFHNQHFRQDNATLIVVGAVAAPLAQTKLEAALGGWRVSNSSSRTASATAWPEIKQVAKRQIYLVDKPGAAQTEIRIGRIGVPRLTEDYYAITVMNTILGGSFTSRLNQNLREEHGYSYGASSSFSFRPLPGPFLAGAAVQTDVTDKALAEFMKELKRILQPAPDDELTRAKNYVALGYPAEFQNVGQIAVNLQEMVTYNLPEDYFNNYISRILSVTKKDVQRVAKKYIDPEKVAIILVGDRKEIEAGVRKLNLGPLELLTIEQVLGKPPTVEGTD